MCRYFQSRTLLSSHCRCKMFVFILRYLTNTDHPEGPEPAPAPAGSRLFLLLTETSWAGRQETGCREKCHLRTPDLLSQILKRHAPPGRLGFSGSSGSFHQNRFRHLFSWALLEAKNHSRKHLRNTDAKPRAVCYPYNVNGVLCFVKG